MGYQVVALRHGECAWSLRIVIDGEGIDIRNSPDSWMTSAAEAGHEQKRITRLLKTLEDSNE